MDLMTTFFLLLALLSVVTVAQGVRIIPQSYVWTVERFGKFTRKLEPGLHL